MQASSVFIIIICLFGFGPALNAQVVNIEEQRITGTNDSTHWYGHLRGSASLVKVKQQSLQLQGQSKVQYKNDPHLALILLNLNLLRAGNKDFAKQAFAHLRYNYKISEKLTAEAYTQLQTSPLQGLKQRGLVGAGLRWRLLKSNNGQQRIYLGVATLWEHNIFEAPNRQQYWNRSSNYISYTFRLGPQNSLVGTTYWQPVWGFIHNYRLSTQWLLKIGLTKKLSLTINFSYNLDKNLPPGAAAETYAWRNGINWQL